MNSPKLKTGLSFMLALLAACAPNRAYVPAGFDPLLVEKKGDFTLSASGRPFKFVKAGFTCMPFKDVAVRAGWSGIGGLSIFEGSVLFAHQFSKIGIFAGPYYNYQSNYIHRSYSIEIAQTGRTYSYGCEFSSPALVCGIKLGSLEKGSFHLIFKASYNMVNKYSYNYESDNASGMDSYYEVQDNETLSYPQLSNFLSYEFSYAYVYPLSKFLSISFQGGVNICQKVYEHHYSFQTHAYGSNGASVSNTTFHPVTKPFFLSFGLTWRFGNSGLSESKAK